MSKAGKKADAAIGSAEKAAIIEQMSSAILKADKDEHKDGEGVDSAERPLVASDSRTMLANLIVAVERAAWSRSRRGVNEAWAQLNAAGIFRPATFADAPVEEPTTVYRGQPLGDYDIHTDSFWLEDEQRWVPSVEIAAHNALEQRTGSETT